MDWVIGQNVPWNAGWSSELAYEVRNCRWAGGRPALWSPHSPGQGRPIFAKPHMVRQRRSIAEMRCTVCGERTPVNDRWWFGLGHLINEGSLFATTESPVHRDCAEHALRVCPHLRDKADMLKPLPKWHTVIAAIVGGPATDRDFGLKIRPEGVIGHLKIAWEASQILGRNGELAGKYGIKLL